MKTTTTNSKTNKEIKTSSSKTIGDTTSAESIETNSTTVEQGDLSPKDEIETLLKLADSSWRDFDTRRSYEWKISFGLWVAIATLSGFAIKEGIVLSDWSIIFQLLIAFFYAFIWSANLYDMNFKNQETARKFWKKAAEKTGLNSEEAANLYESKQKSKLAILNWSHGSQIVITILFLVISFLALTGRYDEIKIKEKENPPNIRVINLINDN
jgi:hypothetical protein